MSTFTLISSTCMARSCTLVYQSADTLIGLVVESGGRAQDRRRYFVWNKPDSAPAYATEAEARQALAQTVPRRRKRLSTGSPLAPTRSP
jgi:hypothetical protein